MGLRIKPAYLFTAAVISIFYSCSGAAPEIGRTIWQINNVKTAENTVYQELSVFVLVEDEDGINDIDSIYLVNDDQELVWKLNSGNWQQRVISGKNWLGTNSLLMPGSPVFMSGNYRIIVTDLAGEQDIDEIFISAEKVKQKKSSDFPELKSNDFIEIDSPYKNNTLWIYNDKMEIIKNFKLTEGRISKDIISRDTDNKAKWISIYSLDPDNGSGYISGPFEFIN